MMKVENLTTNFKGEVAVEIVTLATPRTAEWRKLTWSGACAWIDRRAQVRIEDPNAISVKLEMLANPFVLGWCWFPARLSKSDQPKLTTTEFGTLPILHAPRASAISIKWFGLRCPGIQPLPSIGSWNFFVLAQACEVQDDRPKRRSTINNGS